MFQAQYIHKGGSVLSPWFPREGDNILVVAELIEFKGGPFEIRLIHKNEEDVGPGTKVSGGTLTISTSEVSSKQYRGLKELIRYEMTHADSSTGSYSLFRMLSPSWWDDIAGSSL